jgi:hypothetical protein
VEQGETLAVVRMEQKVSMDSAIRAVHLKTVVQETSEDLVISGLAGLILRTASFFNIGRPMSEDQAIESAYLLMEKYPYESLEDFVIMLRNAKLGKYGDGKLYNRLDGMIIFGWMAEYMEEKAAYREKLHQQMKNNDKDLNIRQIALDHADTATGKPVIEALKIAIGWDQQEGKSDAEYYEFRKKFITDRVKKTKNH